MFVKNFKTPLLVIHGEMDYRVPVGEGLQLFTALQRQGVDSKLLYFPDEGHWILNRRTRSCGTRPSSNGSTRISSRKHKREDSSRIHKRRAARKSLQTYARLSQYLPTCVRLRRRDEEHVPSPATELHAARVPDLRTIAELVAVLVCALRLLVVEINGLQPKFRKRA